MNIEFKITKIVKKVSVDQNGIICWVSLFIIPIAGLVLTAPYLGPLSTLLAAILFFGQIIIGGILCDGFHIDEDVAYFFMWIPVLLLAPLTIPWDIFSSVSKTIWNKLSKNKSEKKLKKSYRQLIEKGLDSRKIETDTRTLHEDISKTATELFAEIIYDQLGRSLLSKKSGVLEKTKLIKHEKVDDNICLIGSFTVTECKPREDGSKSSTIDGRVFGITFSISKHTEIFKVIHHISRNISEVHGDEQLEDMWFDLTSASGILSETASDPWDRRASKHLQFRNDTVIVSEESDPMTQTQNVPE